MERHGVPSAAIAVEQLAKTVGISMAAAHGFPNYPMAMVDTGQDIAGIVDGAYSEAVGGSEEIDRLADRISDIWRFGFNADDPKSE